MNGDSGDVDCLIDPLLCSMMSYLHYLPQGTEYMQTFVSSEGCHIVAEAYLLFVRTVVA